jgi:hypothetical protein
MPSLEEEKRHVVADAMGLWFNLSGKESCMPACGDASTAEGVCVASFLYKPCSI